MPARRFQVLPGSDMPEDTRRTVLSIMSRCLAHNASPTGIAQKLDAALGPHWSCIMGTAYSLSVNEDFQTFLNVKHRSSYYTIWCNRTVHGPPVIASGTDEKAEVNVLVRKDEQLAMQEARDGVHPAVQPSVTEFEYSVVSTTMSEETARKVCRHVAAVLSTSPASMVDATEAISFRIENLLFPNAEGAWDVLIGFSPAFIPPDATLGSTIVLTHGQLTVTIYHSKFSVFDNDGCFVHSIRMSQLLAAGTNSPSFRVSPVPADSSDDCIPGSLALPASAATSLQPGAADGGVDVKSMPSKASAAVGTATSALLTVDPPTAARAILRTAASASLAILTLLLMMI